LSNPCRVGQRSNGPATLASHAAVSCHFPKAAVAYPLSRSVSASGAVVLGIWPVEPGIPVAISVMNPMFTVWWFRPDFSAARVGEHRAVVWKLLYRSPFWLSRSSVDMATGPPKLLGTPNPMSSISTMTTFGAPAGAFTSNRGGIVTFRTATSL
jgi:hypothetical protein